MNHHFRAHLPFLAAALAFAASSTQAADLTVSGTAVFHNDIVQIDFTLDIAGTNVRIWTDSWMSGTNFDPTTVVWARNGDGFSFVQFSDDDDTVGIGQGFYDAGFSFPTLAAGQYRLTLGAAVNAHLGSQLSDGFLYDNQTPIPLAVWNQPTYDPNFNDQKGGFWRVQFSGVDAVTVVPEPGTWALMALGLAGLAGLAGAARGARRRQGS